MRCGAVNELDSIEEFLKAKGELHNAVIQGLDFRGLEINWDQLNFQGAIFLGCHFPKEVKADFLVSKGAVLFPKFSKLPYNPYRNRLYSRDELIEGWTKDEDKSVDKRIYDHFVKMGGSKSDVLESLSQRLHDHAMDDALGDLLDGRVDNGGKKKVVGIMGGHSTGRDTESYEKIVRIARQLAQDGYFIASGGGPGIMEAANLGAWLSVATDQQVDKALDILKVAPFYSSEGFQEAALAVLEMVPEGGDSISVPTWFYGHEPSNLFSRYIAKYFSNSIREDGLLAMADCGVIFASGSAGTTQEIFMDATQNHYVTFDVISPMVFLGEKRYKEDTMLYPCLEQLAEGRAYADYLFCSDDVGEIVDFIKDHPPIKSEG